MSLYIILLFSSITFAQSLTATATTTNVSCNGDCDGSVSIDASGGTLPYYYSKDNGSPQTSNTFSGLCTGTYNFKIEDSENNIYEFVLSILEPVPLNATINISPSGIENSGVLEIIANGGTSPYFFSVWDNNYNFSSSPNNIYSDLAAGSYTVEVIDSNGCLIHQIVTINEVNIDNTISIKGDELTANVGADTFQWINSETQTIIEGETNKTLKAGKLGKFRVEMTLENPNPVGKSLKSLQTISLSSPSYEVTTVLGVNNSMNKVIKLYPNPAKSHLTFPNTLTNKEYTIYSISGKRVLSGVILNHEILIDKLEKGFYFLKIKEYIVTKFVKI